SLALAEGNIQKKYSGGAYWFEFKRNGIKHVCVPAVGHLFVLDTKGKGWKYPIFDTEWIPSFKRKGAQFTKNYFKNLEIAASKANDFIVCCDYDTEGEVIGYNILRFICKREDAKRMKFSTLTKEDIINAYENMMNHIDFGQAEAGLTRHYLDFLWGINTTRALTLALKNSMKKGFTVVSTGRVQGPTLAILAQREWEIKNFKPTPFWELELHVMFGKTEVIATYEKDKIWDKEEAERIYNSCKGKDAIVKGIEKKKYKVNPPTPFDTTTLQTESYRCFGYSPAQTLSIAESLYIQGYISYPRTSSQQLPEKIGLKNILQSLSKLSLFKKDASCLLAKKELKPMQGKKTDPAHPAIYPTSQTPDLGKLTSQQKRLYELIVRRFLAVFGDPSIRESTKVILDVASNIFYANGQRILEPGWVDLYGRFAV
ncbi:MAG: DNA topoisomerase I, partial [Fervidobacterium sp.]